MLRLFLFVSLFASTIQAAHSQAPIFVYKGQLGPSEDDPATLHNPIKVAIDPVSNDYLVVDRNFNTLRRFSESGDFVDSFVPEGPFYTKDIAIDADTRDIYITNDDDSIIRVFDSSGNFVRMIANGAATNGGAIAIDTVRDRLYAINGNSVSIFALDGTPIGGFGSSGQGQGQFNGPGSISVDPVNGTIFVSDGRMQAFTPAGSFVQEYSVAPDRFGAVSFNSSTRKVFAVSAFNHSYHVLAESGELLQTIGSYGAANGHFNFPNDIAVDSATGRVAVADFRNRRIQVFGQSGNFLSVVGNQGYFVAPKNVRYDPTSELVAVSDGLSLELKLFNRDGTFFRQFGPGGTELGYFAGGTNTAFSWSSPEIVVADYGNCRVQVLSLYDDTAWSFGECGTSTDQFSAPSAVAITSPDNRILVADSPPDGTGLPRIKVFDSAGIYVAQFGAGRISYVNTIAIHPVNGEIYISDNQREIKVFSSDYQFLREIDSRLPDDKIFIPSSIAIDSGLGILAVCDFGGDRVKLFDLSGVPIGIVGGSGSAEGLFGWTSGVSFDEYRHELYVSDDATRRVQIFQLDAIFAGSFDN